MRDKHHHDSRAGYRRRNKIAGQWAAHQIEMIASPAWRVLSLAARRVLDQLEIEHCNHGGAHNGSLVVTFDDLERDAHIHRQSIAPAIREAVALGFIEIMRKGRAAKDAGGRASTLYRITYLAGIGDSPAPTHEWRKIKTWEQAKASAASARKAGGRSVSSRSSRKQNVGTDSTTGIGTDSATRRHGFIGTESVLQSPTKTVPPCISRGGWSGGGGGRDVYRQDHARDRDGVPDRDRTSIDGMKYQTRDRTRKLLNGGKTDQSRPSRRPVR
jgi:hypothetical protein